MEKERKRINPSFDLETYSQICHIAAINNISASEQMRRWAIEGINGTVCKSNIDLISKILRHELQSIINPKIERLAALSAKTCVQSSTATYLSAQTISKLLPEELQEDYEEVYNLARKKAALYTKTKLEGSEDEDI